MQLAKQHLDIGIFAKSIERHYVFWKKQIGLRFEFELRIRGEWIQNRFNANNSIIKVNCLPAPKSEPITTGYTCLSIASSTGPAWKGTHPDGGLVRLVPKGTDGIVGVGVTVTTPNVRRMMDFYVNTMEFEPLSASVARCGQTLLLVEKGPGGVDTDSVAGQGPSYRYLTVQVHDTDKETAGIIARGGRLAIAPADFDVIARTSFIKDPDGNLIEISARSPTGVGPGGWVTFKPRK